MPMLETKGAGSVQGFGFSLGGSSSIPYVDSVFSADLYTGSGSAKTISNGIDLGGNGGLVWIKRREIAWNPQLLDTVRGAGSYLSTTLTNAAAIYIGYFNFTSSGFSFPNGGTNAFTQSASNSNGGNYAAWTFRRRQKFFDIVTYSGSGSAQTIAHGLGSAPGCIIVKRINAAGNWQVYHRGLTSAAYGVQLNLTSAEAIDTTLWNSTAPTSSVFTVGSNSDANAAGYNYIAYLFAHNAGGFGLTGTENVISCSSVTTSASASTYTSVNLGYEPQWILLKNATTSGNWQIIDNMRGLNADGTVASLFPNVSDQENSYASAVRITATGFDVNSDFLGTSQKLIYVAVRRGGMKPPTDATKVFAPYGNIDGAITQALSPFVPDMLLGPSSAGGTYDYGVADRLRGIGDYWNSVNAKRLVTQTTAAETSSLLTCTYQNSSGFRNGNYLPITYMFKRSRSFFDVVCYTGTGAVQAISHGLGVAPEMMLIKSRNGTARRWAIYHSGIGPTGITYLDASGITTISAAWNNTAPTSTQFTVGLASNYNASGENIVAYLFATCPGVSKVGTYTGNGSSQSIDCGFSSGPRFIWIKSLGNGTSTESYVWDTARGLTAGNDPFITLNTTAAEVTGYDSVDPSSTGFTVNQDAGSNINVSGIQYIYLAIA